MASTDSSSGEITSSFVNISDVFTQYAEIPSNGFNLLYKAQRYGKWFVLKGLKPEFRNSAIHLQLLTKEFELGIQMSHPNIVQLFSKEVDPVVGECIVMEYVDGQTLSDFLKTKPNGNTREKIALQLLQAMAYYQSLKIIHRDLKPQNILITRNGNNVKIIDFGLSDTDDFAILKQPAGSPKYMAPEQAKDNVEIDARADLYAFSKILQTIFPSLPLAWRQVVRRCGQEKREKCPTNAEAVLQMLLRAKRSRILTGALLSLSLLAIALVVTFYVIKNQYVDRYVSEVGTTAANGPEGRLMPNDSVLATAGTVTVIHDTVVQYKEKAELTADMTAFLKQQSDNYWSAFNREYQKYENRINKLMNGEAGDIQEDMKIYNELWTLYSNLLQNSPSELENQVVPALKKKFSDAQYVESFEITTTFYKFSNHYHDQISQRLVEFNQAIQKYDK